jgi:peptide/nickel transport system substrate-binding protein
LTRGEPAFIAKDYVNGYLFQLAALSVAKADVRSLWVNAPTQATNLTAVNWRTNVTHINDP